MSIEALPRKDRAAPERGPTNTPSAVSWPWIAVILALLVGLAGGYALRLGIAGTKTVTRTVTRTIPPAAYTTSGQVDARVAFDGATCSYTGPAEFKAGTVATFAYAAPATLTPPRNATLMLFSVKLGTTWEDMVQSVATHPVDQPPAFVIEGTEAQPMGAPRQSLTLPLSGGLWGVGCATSGGKMVLATMLRVVG